MRRALTGLLAAGVLAALAAPAGSQQEEGLAIEPTGAHVYLPYEPPATPERVWVVSAGERYRFQVDYRVSGAAEIGTGHLFVFENAVTGERMQVATRSFPPEGPGAYNESTTGVIPADWEPGVYRFRWTLTARHSELPTVRATGASVFLVVDDTG